MSAGLLEERLLTSPPVQILVVDDDEEVRSWVVRYLGIPDILEVRTSASPDDVDECDASEEYDLCILDNRFDGRELIARLLNTVTSRWPRAKLLFLTNHPSPELLGHSRDAHPVITKDAFQSDPALLIREILALLKPLLEDRIRSFRSLGARGLVYKELNRLFDTDGPVRDIYSVKGHVLGVSKPHIQVLVDEEGPGGSKGKKLLMRYSLFASAGILEEGMPFRFRVYEQGNRVISEVVPIEGALRRLDPDVEAEVSRIEAIEHEYLREIANARHEPKSP